METVRPACLIAELKHSESADSEVLAIWAPAQRTDNIVVWGARIQLTTYINLFVTVVVPHLISAVLPTADDKVVGWVPIGSQDDTVVCFPLQEFGAAGHRLNGDASVRAVQNCVAVWAPHHAVYRLLAGNQIAPNVTILRPDLQGSVFAGSG